MWKPGLSEELNSLLWLGGVGDFQRKSAKPYYSVEALANGMKQYNDVLLRVCRQRGIESVDLSYLEKDTTVFYDDVHFNEGGARKVSSVLASYFLGHYPFNDCHQYALDATLSPMPPCTSSSIGLSTSPSPTRYSRSYRPSCFRWYTHHRD